MNWFFIENGRFTVHGPRFYMGHNFTEKVILQSNTYKYFGSVDRRKEVFS